MADKKNFTQIEIVNNYSIPNSMDDYIGSNSLVTSTKNFNIKEQIYKYFVKYFEKESILNSLQILLNELFEEAKIINSDKFSIDFIFFYLLFSLDQDSLLEDLILFFDGDKLSPTSRTSNRRIMKKIDKISDNINKFYQIFYLDEKSTYQTIQFMIKIDLDLKVFEIVLRNLNYSYAETSIDIYKDILAKEKFSFLEKLAYINQLFANSKLPRQKCDIVKKVLYQKVKKFVRTKILKLFILELKVNDFEDKPKTVDELAQRLIKYCIENKVFYIFKIIVSKLKLSIISKEIFSFSMNFDCYISVKMFKKFNLYKFITSDIVWDQIENILNEKENFIHGIYFLQSSIKKLKFSSIQHLKILKIIENLYETKQINYFMTCVNPITLLILISDFCYKNSKLIIPFYKKYQILANNFKDIANNYIKYYIMNVDECKNILYKTIYPMKKNLIDILFDEKDYFLSILTQDIILRVIEGQSEPKINFDYNILAASSAFSIIKSKNLDYKTNSNLKAAKSFHLNSVTKSKSSINLGNISLSDDFSTKSFFYLINILNIVKRVDTNRILKNNHFYQLCIYSKSISYRLILEGLFYLIIFWIVFPMLINFNLAIFDFSILPVQKLQDIIQNDPFIVDQKYININNNLEYNLTHTMALFNPENNIEKLSCIYIIYSKTNMTKNFNLTYFVEEYIDPCQQFLIVIKRIETILNTFSYGIGLAMLVGLVFLNNLLFFYKMNQKILINLNFFYDLLLFLLSTNILIIRYLFDSLDGEKMIIISNLCRIDVMIIILCLWMKLYDSLKIIKNIAFIQKIISHMIKDLMSFNVILIIVFLAFGSITYSLLGRSIENNSELINSIFNIISATFGAFTLSAVDVNYILYSIILILVLFLVTIILYNLLIAILSNTYNKLMKKANMEYGLLVHKLVKMKKFDSNYGALILFPVPINIIVYPFLPLFFFKNTEFLNKILTFFGFIIISFFHFGIFVVLNIIIIPFSFYKILFLILRNKYRYEKSSRNIPFYFILFHFVIWNSIGLIFMIVLFIFNDIPLFWTTIFKVNNNKVTSLKFPDFFYNFFVYFIDDLQSSNNVELSFENFNKLFFEKFKEWAFLKKNQILNKKGIDKDANLHKFYFKMINFFNENHNEIIEFLKRFEIKDKVDIKLIFLIIKNYKFSCFLQKKNIFELNYQLLKIMNPKALHTILNKNKDKINRQNEDIETSLKKKIKN